MFFCGHGIPPRIGRWNRPPQIIFEKQPECPRTGWASPGGFLCCLASAVVPVAVADTIAGDVVASIRLT